MLSWVAVGLLGTAAGALIALQAVVTLATALLAGPWADRLEQGRLMIAADLARAAVLLILAAVWFAQGAATVWSLVATILTLAAGQALFRPALQATLPALVPRTEFLPATNALLDTTERIARLLGPGLIGLASTWLPLVHFVTFDAATFAASALAILAITCLRPTTRQADITRAPLLRGFTALRRHKLLGFMLTVTGVINGAWHAAFFLGLPLMLTQTTNLPLPGLAAYGFVISAYGSTNLLSTLVVGSLPLPRNPARRIFAGNAILGAGTALLGLAAYTPWPLQACLAAAAIAAIGGPMHDITMATLRQTELASADMAAAVRAFMVMNQLGLLAVLLASPIVFNTIGTPPAIMLCGIAVLGVSILGMIKQGQGAALDPPMA